MTNKDPANGSSSDKRSPPPLPGIYLPEFGVRSEVDVFVDGDGNVHVTGGELQTEIVPILAEY